MQYQNITTGTFLSRPNRFIAKVTLNSSEVVCHVKNTGRCKELLIPGTKVLIEYHPEAKALGRSTSYSLIGVYKGDLLINMDSQAPNQAAYEWLLSSSLTLNGLHPSVSDLRREVKYGDSRFDLSFTMNGAPAYMEVKGVTLEQDGIARFPDAPTLRGVKHIQELIKACNQGFEAFILFVIQMKSITAFEPNIMTQPEFGTALMDAKKTGVNILAYDCVITENSMIIDSPIPVHLK